MRISEFQDIQGYTEKPMGGTKEGRDGVGERTFWLSRRWCELSEEKEDSMRQPGDGCLGNNCRVLRKGSCPEPPH